VTVQPDTAEGGGFTVVSFRVPNERDNASTIRVPVTLPKDQPIGSVRTTPVPGWKVATTTRHLDQPIEMFGEPDPLGGHRLVLSQRAEPSRSASRGFRPRVMGA
jgi:uncharacterized protein YcnI